MKVSLIKRLENHARLRPTEWISGMDYGLLAYKQGYKPDTASRRLRELEVAGVLEARTRNGYVEYKWKSAVGIMTIPNPNSSATYAEKNDFHWTTPKESKEVPSVAGMGRLFG